MAVERSLGDGARWICVSSFLISDSSAAIWLLSVRARSEIGSAFFFDDAIIQCRSKMAMKMPREPSATSTSGHVIAKPILQSWPKLKPVSGKAAAGGAASTSFFPNASGDSVGNFRRAVFHSMRAFSMAVSARVSSV